MRAVIANGRSAVTKATILIANAIDQGATSFVGGEELTRPDNKSTFVHPLIGETHGPILPSKRKIHGLFRYPYCNSGLLFVVGEFSSRRPIADGGLRCRHRKPVSNFGGLKNVGSRRIGCGRRYCRAACLRCSRTSVFGNRRRSDSVYRELADGPIRAFDGLARSPSAYDPQVSSVNGFRHGGAAVGIPGSVRLMELVHSRYGKLPWRALFEPAIEAASAGFRVSPYLAKSLAAATKLGFSPPPWLSLLIEMGHPTAPGAIR